MNLDTLKGHWKELAGKAKQTWGQLSDDELLRVEGNLQRLEGLVQQRYGTTREEAAKQVRNFMDRFGEEIEREEERQAKARPPTRH